MRVGIPRTSRFRINEVLGAGRETAVLLLLVDCIYRNTQPSTVVRTSVNEPKSFFNIETRF